MSVQAKTLINAKYALDSTSSEYLVPEGKTTIIDKFTATNHDASARTLSVYLVPAGETPDTSNLIVAALSIAAGATEDITDLQNQILSESDAIHCVASVASMVVIRASGREVT